VRASTTGGPVVATRNLVGIRWALRVPGALRDGPVGARALRDGCDADALTGTVAALGRTFEPLGGGVESRSDPAAGRPRSAP